MSNSRATSFRTLISICSGSMSRSGFHRRRRRQTATVSPSPNAAPGRERRNAGPGRLQQARQVVCTDIGVAVGREHGLERVFQHLQGPGPHLHVPFHGIRTGFRLHPTGPFQVVAAASGRPGPFHGFPAAVFRPAGSDGVRRRLVAMAHGGNAVPGGLGCDVVDAVHA